MASDPESSKDPRIIEYQSFETRWFGVKWVPVVSGCCVIFGIFIPYFICISQTQHHTKLPFISQAAGKPPQNGIIHIFMALFAFAGSLVAMLRYYDVKQTTDQKSRKLVIYNKCAFAVEVTALFGGLMVGAFPLGYYENARWIYTVAVPHTLGAALLFFLNVVYGCIQARLTYAQSPDRKIILVIRVLLAVMSLVCLIMLNIPLHTDIVIWLEKSFSGSGNQTDLIKQFNEKYLTTSFSEWALTIVYPVYVFTYIYEFRNISVRFECSRLESSSKPSSANNLQCNLPVALPKYTKTDSSAA